MFLDSGSAIAGKIQTLINEETTKPVKLAVAFWGVGAEYRLRGDCQIICDLESGACNPAVIRTLRKRDNCVVLKLSGLHAKVVISSAGAVVSSANMSTNGLDAEASRTIEAGYFVSKMHPDYKKIVAWFEDVWGKATEITEPDLAKAQEKWDFRNQEMPITPSTKPESDTSPIDIDPSSLLEERIDTDHRLRTVKPYVFNHFKDVLPEVDHRQLGKIAIWACHLLLNRAGRVLEYSARNGEKSGLATDQWIVGRFIKNNETVAKVETLIKKISRDPLFSADVRRSANQVLSVPPWIDHDRYSDQE